MYMGEVPSAIQYNEELDTPKDGIDCPVNIDKLVRSRCVVVTIPEISVDRQMLVTFMWEHELSIPALANILRIKKNVVRRWITGKKKIPFVYQLAIHLMAHGAIRSVYKVDIEEKLPREMTDAEGNLVSFFDA